jgi:hypothetical protein
MPLFLANKYRLWYFQIIENSKSRVLRSGTERHHIIPKCFGGSNDPENIALLTYREHFLAHWLLPKFTGGKLRYKMLSALWQMARVPKHYTRMTASWQYEVARAAVAEVTKARSIGNKYGVGRKWTAIEHERHQCMLQQRRETPTPKEWREKISQGKRGIKASQETKMKMSASRIGKKHTEETKRKMSLASAGRPKTSVMREKLRQHKLGKKLSLETRRRMSAAHLARHSMNATLTTEGI